MYYEKDKESKPATNARHNTSAWLMDKKIGKIVLHNRSQGNKGAKEAGSRTWISCVTGERRND